MFSDPLPRASTLGVLAFLLVSMPQPAQAQLGGLGNKIKQKAQQRVDQKADEVADSIVNKADPTVARKSGSPTAASGAASGSGARTVWPNFDFLPGQRTLFYTDFTDEQVGNFPRRLQFKTGSMEVVELDGQRALKASGPSGLVIPLVEPLPARFTVEMDVINRNSRGVAAPTLRLYGGTAVQTDADRQKTRVAYGHNGWDVTGGGTETAIDFTSAEADAAVGRPVTVRVLADGAYLKVYADGRRLANIPNADFLRAKGLFLALEARDGETNAVYVTRIRVAESLKSIYEELEASGRWSTQGILFDTGKSLVRAESAPTLKEIAAVLTQHPDLRIRIEGHTDNVGNAASNRTLSDARAAAVKQALVSQHGIAADRIETTGMGDTKPVADNRTPEGRSSNRRVEVVKL